MDIFLEQIVKKENNLTDLLKRLGIIIGGIIVIVLDIFILPVISTMLSSFSFLIAAGIIYLMWLLLTGMNVEYEYILTNGEIDIDKIIGKRKRKRLITVKCNDFYEFGRYKDKNSITQEYKNTIMACTSETANDTYYAVTEHPKYGKTLILFNPNEKMIENSKKYIKRSVIKD